MNFVLPDFQRSRRHSNCEACKTMDIEQCQDVIYQFVLQLVHKYLPERALEEFQCLFFNYQQTDLNEETLKALFEMLFKKDRDAFHETLKRCCYILINNWATERYIDNVLKLVESFEEVNFDRPCGLLVRSRLNNWLKEFVESQDYQDLQLLVSKHKSEKKQTEESPKHWSERYTSYLLVFQYANPENPQEQQEIARTISNQLKCQFKFDLAMYIARSQLSNAPKNRFKNPTALGDSVLKLLKVIVANWDKFGYTHLAQSFLTAIPEFNFAQFKVALLKYVTFYGWMPKIQQKLEMRLSNYLDRLCKFDEDDALENSIILRTCNRTIDLITTTNGKTPSDLFVLLASQGSLLTLVITLARLILICPHARLHLEKRVAQLVQYYMDYPEEDCHWVVSFFELFNIIFTLYIDGDTQYSLLRNPNDDRPHRYRESLKNYQIFSQHRSELNYPLLLGLPTPSTLNTSIPDTEETYFDETLFREQ
ncbi:hypothetical protein [Baaleninema sp.]|uniref:hypothetical protein n=1 Tax=Baaleninema sp. TaxID=3101197 RepID=UPI003D0302E8